MSFGDQIRFIRGDSSQEEFALIFHVHRNTVSLWENDITMPQGVVIVQMHDLLDVNLNWLFTGEGEPYRDGAE